MRELGGLVLLLVLVVCAVQWRRRAGLPVAAGLTALYVLAFVGSHLLARVVGAWPSVLLVAAVVAAASSAALARTDATAR